MSDQNQITIGSIIEYFGSIEASVKSEKYIEYLPYQRIRKNILDNLEAMANKIPEDNDLPF
jgi:hypothetical protein